jgi:TldD protein
LDELSLRRCKAISYNSLSIFYANRREDEYTMGELAQLTSFGLTEGEVLGALGRVKVRDVDYADLYFESCVSESVSMEESLVKRATKSVSQGVGVRATAGEKTGFAYSDELTKKDLELAADTARYIANSPRNSSGAGPPMPNARSLSDRTSPGRSRDAGSRVLVECD